MSQLLDMVLSPDDTILIGGDEPPTFTTAGEALMVKRLAAAEGWESVMIVTNVTHISRARMIFTDCLGGGVLATDDGAGIEDSNWAWMYAYQSAAFVKALVAPTC